MPAPYFIDINEIVQRVKDILCIEITLRSTTRLQTANVEKRTPYYL